MGLNSHFKVRPDRGLDYGVVERSKGVTGRVLYLEGEILVLKLVPVDALATPAVPRGEIASLNHELGDHAVKLTSLVPETVLTCA